jgi:hypothetical protein
VVEKREKFPANFRPHKDGAMRQERLLHVGTIVGTIRLKGKEGFSIKALK